MRRGAKRGAAWCLLITLCQLFVSQSCWLFLCRLLAESSPCMACGRGTAFGKLLWHCRLWVCVVFVRRLVLLLLPLLLVQYSAKINLFQLIILRQICQPYDPLAPYSLPLWPVMTPAPVTCAAESQKLCKLLPDFDIYGYSGFVGSHRNFFVALFDLAIGSEPGYECAQSFVGPILWVNIRLEYV